MINCLYSPTESAAKAFGIPLSQVIANDRAYKQRQDALKESRRDCLDLEASVLHFRAEKWQHNGNRPLGNAALLPGAASTPAMEVHSKPPSSTFMDNTSRTHRRVRETKCAYSFRTTVCQTSSWQSSSKVIFLKSRYVQCNFWLNKY